MVMVRNRAVGTGKFTGSRLMKSFLLTVSCTIYCWLREKS